MTWLRRPEGRLLTLSYDSRMGENPCLPEKAALQSPTPDSVITIYCPQGFESREQQMAYEELINVLSAILVKYAAGVEKDNK